MAAAARRAVLMGKAPNNVKAALMATAIIRLDQELTRIGVAIKKHEVDCPWFKACCREAVKPACPPFALVVKPVGQSGGTA